MRPRHLPGVIPALPVALAALLAQAGCAGLRVEPPEAPRNLGELTGVELPERWDTETAPSGTPIDADRWWRALGDPLLAELIDRALTGSHDLAAAAARVEAAAARARIAGAPLLPEADATLSGIRARRNFIGFPIPGGEERVLSTFSTTWGASLNLSWEADLWGRVRSGRDAALGRTAAARADLAGAALSLSGQTAKAYFAAREAAAQVELARATLENRRTNRQRVRRRFEAGLRGALDLRLARSEEASAESVLEGRLGALDAAERQLETLVVDYPDRDLPLPAGASGGLPLALAAGPPPVPAGLPSELLARRPDLAAAERRLEAAGFEVARARAALYPGFRLTGSAGRQSDELRDLLDNDFTVWSIAGNLLQPLFQGGRLRDGVDLARASFEEATALYAAAVLRALGEVETALAAERYLEARADALADAAEEARRAQELAEERYRAGLADFLAVLEAQRRTFDAESRLLEVRRQRLDARIDLVLALGGGFAAGAPPDGSELAGALATSTGRQAPGGPTP